MFGRYKVEDENGVLKARLINIRHSMFVEVGRQIRTVYKSKEGSNEIHSTYQSGVCWGKNFSHRKGSAKPLSYFELIGHETKLTKKLKEKLPMIWQTALSRN